MYFRKTIDSPCALVLTPFLLKYSRDVCHCGMKLEMNGTVLSPLSERLAT